MSTLRDQITEKVVSKYFELDRNGRATARELDIPKSTVQDYIRQAKEDPRYKELFGIADTYEVDEVSILKHQIQELKKELNKSKKSIIHSENTKKYFDIFKNQEPTVPDWVSRKPTGKSENCPTLMLSDFHVGEVVQPSAIFNINEYNIDIARERAMEVVDKAIDLSFNHIANPKYPGIVVPILGDMISGLIHDELLITGEKEVLETVLDLIGILQACLTKLADAFGKVFVPCVVGNHGRLTVKPRAKNYVYDSLDWLVYKLLEKFLAEDKRIQFLVSEGEDAEYSIFGHMFRIAHGSAFKGGNGLSGVLPALIRGDMKKRSAARSMDLEYDTLLIGHFHQSLTVEQRLICNGSLVGYNEYASKFNFPFELPTQNFFITNSEIGITFNLPIRVGRKNKKENNNWVSWKE